MARRGSSRGQGSQEAEPRLAPWISLVRAAGVGFEPTGDLSAASGFQVRRLRSQLVSRRLVAYRIILETKGSRGYACPRESGDRGSFVCKGVCNKAFATRGPRPRTCLGDLTGFLKRNSRFKGGVPVVASNSLLCSPPTLRFSTPKPLGPAAPDNG